MEIPKLLKDWRIWLLVILIVGSIFMVAPSNQSSIVVRSVSPDSPLADKLKAGDAIEWVNEKFMETPEDFYAFENFKGTLRYMHNGKLDLAEAKGNGLGIVVMPKPSSKLNFGLDIVGGTRVLLKPTTNASADEIQQAIATLQTRINIYGLREARFQHVQDVSGSNYIQVEMAGGTQSEVDNLLSKQGKFDARIPRVANDGSTFFGEKVKIFNESVTVGNRSLKVNDTIILKGITFQVYNFTKTDAILFGRVFTGADIKSVCLSEQAGICTSRVQQAPGGYQFVFSITTSDMGAKKFAELTRDLGQIVDPNTGETYLESKISFYIDDKQVTELTISGDLAGRELTEPSINGFRTTREDALQEKLSLQSILQSGSLPFSFKVERVEQITPTLGATFLNSALLAGAVGMLAVGIIIFARYKRWKIALPVILTGFAEIVIILGIATIIKWTIDLASIAGIIAIVGTGIDAQIMIVDELLAGSEQRAYTFKQKVKRAMFMIFGSASTVIAAMIPLLFIGVGVTRGFAITTIIGVLVGIFITRPAFSRIAEAVVEKEAQ